MVFDGVGAAGRVDLGRGGFERLDLFGMDGFEVEDVRFEVTHLVFEGFYLAA